MRLLSTGAFRLAAPIVAMTVGGALLPFGCKGEGSAPPAPTLGTQSPGTAALAATLLRPIAAALSPDAKTLYVTAFDDKGQGQILSGAVGGTLSALPTGVTLSYPCGIAVTSDGASLLVADLGDAGSAGATGAVYRGSTSGSLTALTMGTLGYPTAVAISLDDATAYITGSDPMDGQPGLWSIALAGGNATPILKGAPFAYPAAVTVSNDGSVYVADSGATGGGMSSIFRIQAGRPIQINKTPLRMHFPAGLTSAGTGYPDLLFTSTQAIGTEPYLYRLSPDGTTTALMLSGSVIVTEALTITRAAKADTWVVINGVSPAPDGAGMPGVADPSKLDNPDGHVIQLTP